jgi:hypothetical protein
MRFSAEGGDFLEIECPNPVADAYDLHLLVRVRFRGFGGEIGAWVLRAAWLRFAQDLRALEQRRQGKATVEGMSPPELSLTVRSTDHAGHMGVEGVVGAKGHNYAVSMQLAVLAFDPSQLPMLARDAAAIGVGDADAAMRGPPIGQVEQGEGERVKAFLREWDPIGVIPRLLEAGLPPNEYDSYASEVHQRLAAGCTAEDLALTLELIRTKRMGLSPNPAADAATAQRLLAWWRSRDT